MSDIQIDNEFIYTDPLTQKSYPTWAVEAVDNLLYKIRHKNLWDIVEFSIMVWAKKYPKEHKRFLKANKEYRDSRANATGAFKDKSQRTLLHLPHEIDFILNKIARHKIEDYGRLKFYKEFAKRYPGFSTSEKV